MLKDVWIMTLLLNALNIPFHLYRKNEAVYSTLKILLSVLSFVHTFLSAGKLYENTFENRLAAKNAWLRRQKTRRRGRQAAEIYTSKVIQQISPLCPQANLLLAFSSGYCA